MPRVISVQLCILKYLVRSDIDHIYYSISDTLSMENPYRRPKSKTGPLNRRNRRYRMDETSVADWTAFTTIRRHRRDRAFDGEQGRLGL